MTVVYRIKWRAALSFEEFAGLADQLVDKVPPRLCTELNGGFMVIPAPRRDRDMYIMGEFVEDPSLGRFIVFYYGSFAAILGMAPRTKWEEELRETVWHELRHHLEALAGVDDLTIEELKELAACREQKNRRGRD